jgi:hypothetical protein
MKLEVKVVAGAAGLGLALLLFSFRPPPRPPGGWRSQAELEPPAAAPRVVPECAALFAAAAAPPPPQVRPNAVVERLTQLLPPRSGPFQWVDPVVGLGLHVWRVDGMDGVIAVYGPYLPMGTHADWFNPAKAWEPKVVLARMKIRGQAEYYRWFTELAAGNFGTALPRSVEQADVYAYRTWEDALAAHAAGTPEAFARHAGLVEAYRNVTIH